MTKQYKSISERYSQDGTEAQTLAEKSVTKIQQLGLKPNPIHFTLIFEWLSQNDPALFEQIDQAIADNHYNNTTAEHFYTNLIGQLLFSSIPSQEISSLLNNLQTHISNWSTNNQQRQKDLQGSIQNLVEMDLDDAVREPIVNQIAPSINELFKETESLKKEVEKASQEILLLKKELARTTEIGKVDELTNVANRNGFHEILNNTVQEANQKQSSFAVILIDLDYFTKINEEFGYLIGDSVLRYIAKLVSNEIGQKGDFARYDGQQFMIVLPHSFYDSAIHIAESIRHKISSRPLQIKSSNKTLNLSLSAGVTLYQVGEDVDKLLHRVCEQLDEAKTNGRNRISSDN